MTEHSLQDFTMTRVPKNMSFYSEFSRAFSVTEFSAPRIYNDACSKNMPFYSKFSRAFSVTELSLQDFTMTRVPKACPFIVNSAEHSP